MLAEPANGCEVLSNADAVAGKVALIILGGCAFNDKFASAEAAGAIAVRAVALVSPDEVSSQAEVSQGPDGPVASGSVDIEVGFGYSGAYTAAFEGLSESLALANAVSADATLAIECFYLPAGTPAPTSRLISPTRRPADMSLWLISSQPQSAHLSTIRCG